MNLKSLFCVSKVPLVLPSYFSHHLVVSNCPRWHRKQQQQGLLCCQNMLLFDKEETVGTYKELRKKKMQLKRSNFYYSCRRAPALRRRTVADTFYISSSACALAHKVCKSHFRVLQQENCLQLLASNKEESRLPCKINFYVVIYSLTSLIGNKDKTIEKKTTYLRDTYAHKVCPNVLGTLKTVPDLSRPSFNAFMSRCFEASLASPTSATQSSSAVSLVLPDEPPCEIHNQLHLVGVIPEPKKSQEPTQLLADGSCLADLVFAGTPIQSPLTSGSWLSPVPWTICYIQCSASPLWIGKHSLFFPVLPCFTSTPAPHLRAVAHSEPNHRPQG